MGGGSCTDSNTDEEQAILIPQEALSATIAADSGLKHTVSFETTGEWQASVESPGSGDTWITLSPTFGNAGKNTITATLTENIQPTSRKAVITILCGTESAAITITQQGTGTSEEPAKPEHPEISPENRLTYIEVSENKKTTTEDGTEESYEGENETYIEASVENSSSILYDKEIRNKPRTRRTKRNV